jgi:hypothetical protein
MPKPLLQPGVSPRHAAPRRTAARDLRAELIDPLVDGRWESFVAAAPGANVFHHRAWITLLHRTFGFPMIACCMVDGSGTIRAGAPLAFVSGGLRRARLSSLPLAPACPPLPTAADDPLLASRLVCALDELRRSMRVPIEIRGPVGAHPSAYVSARHRISRIRLHPALDEIVARHHGGVVEHRTDAGALAEHHELRLRARRRLGLPTEPRRFALHLAHLFDRGLGSVLLVRDGRRAVAGAILLGFNGAAVYGYRVVDAGAPPGAEEPMILDAIRWARACGMRTLELGPAHVADAGALGRPRPWVEEETSMRYHRLADGPPRSRDKPGGTLSGPLVRRGPLLISRLLGEAQCRWAS